MSTAYQGLGSYDISAEVEIDKQVRQMAVSSLWTGISGCSVDRMYMDLLRVSVMTPDLITQKTYSECFQCMRSKLKVASCPEGYHSRIPAQSQRHTLYIDYRPAKRACAQASCIYGESIC